MVWRTVKGDIEHTQRDLHAKYGRLVRIAPNEVGCSDPKAAKIIYGGYLKTDFCSVLGNKTFSKHPNQITCVDGKLHTDRRGIVNAVYSLSNVLKSEKYFDQCWELFIQRMRD